MSRRAGAALLVTISAMTCAGCAGRMRGPTLAPDELGAVGLYRGWAIEGASRGPRFRLWLQIVPPDGVHAELLPPIGGPEWILDARGDRTSVTRVAEGTAYVGEAGPRDAERLFGLPVSIVALVAALWSGAEPGGSARIERVPAGLAGLPERFELRSGERGFLLERIAVRRGGHGVARGEPPPGVLVRPLDELGEVGLFDLGRPEGSSSP